MKIGLLDYITTIGAGVILIAVIIGLAVSEYRSINRSLVKLCKGYPQRHHQ